jgi:PAS domain S-box-containing protein
MISNAVGIVKRLAWILLFLVVFAYFGSAQLSPPRILIIYSYHSNVVPYSDVSAAFQTTLVRNLGHPVEYHEVSLELDQFPELPTQSILADFIKQRFKERPLALAVTIGAPAAQFVVHFRDSAFAGTPVVFLSADPRILKVEPSRENATLVTQRISPADWVEDILQITPDTNNVVFLFGVSPLERAWANIIRRELQTYSGRIRISVLEGMPFDEMEKRISALPAHSFIHAGLVVRDQAGISYGGHEALRRLHAAANAPVNGIYKSQMGFGIMGGRLYQDKLIGTRGAEAAARILRGEPAASIPSMILQPPSPEYDWRELKRWGIPESRLPAGSTILFRELGFGERYRWWILGAIAFFAIETLLVFALLINRFRRHRAQESLRQSEQKFRKLYESMMDAFVAVDMTGRIKEFNPAYGLMLGYTEEELLHRTYQQLTPEKWHDYEANIIRDQVMSQGYSTVYEKEYRRKDGTVFPVELRTYLIQDDSGRPAAMWAIVRDISERKRAQEMLQRRNRYIETILEKAPIGFAIHTVDDGVARFVSARYEEIYGVPRGTIDSHYTFFDKVWPHDAGLREKIRRRVVADMQSGDASRMHWEQIPVPAATGKIRYINAVNIPVLDQNLMVSTVRDVTDQVRAQEALRESENRFRQVTELISDFVWEVDADGLYTYTSPTVERILGYAPEELVGKKHFYDLFAPEVREELKSDALSVFAQRRQFQEFPNVNVDKSGRIVHLETSGRPILDEAGNLLGYRGADTDVTDRRNAEMETQRIRQELALFSRVATMGELTASIAHELNQPLTAILSNAQAALRLIQNEQATPEGLHEIFEDIVSDDQRAAEIIRSLRTLLKKGNDGQEPLLLNDMIRDIFPIVRSDALAKNVSVTLDMGSPARRVKGDRVQLQQVILNLAINAFEAMEASEGSRELKLKTFRDNEEIVLAVSDSGPGIPADKLAAIFEPFFTTKLTGLGMGLPLCRTIIAAHGGRIWAENNPNGGATFQIALPVEP